MPHELTDKNKENHKTNKTADCTSSRPIRQATIFVQKQYLYINMKKHRSKIDFCSEIWNWKDLVHWEILEKNKIRTQSNELNEITINQLQDIIQPHKTNSQSQSLFLDLASTVSTTMRILQTGSTTSLISDLVIFNETASTQ